jgi:hypothetical protein
MRRGVTVAVVAMLAVITVLTACGGGSSSSGPSNPGPVTTTPFTLETVDATGGDTGVFPAMAVDQLGTVHVSYLDRANERFRYARRAGGTWTRSEIADAGSSAYSTYGKFSGVDFDSAGAPAVSFHDADVSYVYAKGNATGSSWAKTSIPSPAIAYAFMGHNGIAVDRGTDTAHVVNWDYGNNPAESLGSWTPGGSKIAVSGPPNATGGLHHGIDCTVAVDTHGWPSFAYTSWNGLAGTSAKNFVTWAQATSASTWTLRDVEENARGWSGTYEEKWIAFAMDSSNRPHLAYYKAGLDRIRYATWTGSGWTIETVAQPSLNMSALVSVAIALDSAGTPHVAYYGLGDKVTYAKRTGPSAWTTQVVDTSTNDTGHGVAIGVDAAGHVHIVYRDDTAGSLRYARR